ncbi:unnamed protein product [Pleuronectes platessa]|uniref:Uncharacterized protein n=1 Tax=Pleuronectes platessa TaxID=8262 RepID=A0A9N7UCK2_PLEPL|nr:unnamed protein product [Pleuronectes platessa]
MVSLVLGRVEQNLEEAADYWASKQQDQDEKMAAVCFQWDQRLSALPAGLPAGHRQRMARKARRNKHYQECCVWWCVFGVCVLCVSDLGDVQLLRPRPNLEAGKQLPRIFLTSVSSGGVPLEDIDPYYFKTRG